MIWIPFIKSWVAMDKEDYGITKVSFVDGILAGFNAN